MVRILLVDDDIETCRCLAELFSKEGYEVVSAKTGHEANSLTSEKNFDIIYTNLTLPDMSGLEIIRQAKKIHPSSEVIVITDTPSIETAVEAIKLGACDYIRKPLLPDKIRIITRKVIQTAELALEVQYLRHEIYQSFGFDNIIAKSRKMMEIFKIMRQTASGDSNVLITGESGTGKELVARAIHYNSLRNEHRFVPVNCGAISKELIEAELFGYVKGAFSGAIRDKEGFLDLASGGTLFLDEIGETMPHFQVKLLRAIQEGEFNKVGSPYPTQVDVRVIAASNRDLKEAMADGSFRKDLFYRLNVIAIHIPPLRERPEDIPFLVRHFLEKYSKKRTDKKIIEITSASNDLLINYDYPGNVRELENAIDHAVTFAHGNKITPADLPLSIRSRKAASLPKISLKPFKAARNEFDRAFITDALKECGGNISKTAKLLSIHRQGLQQKIKALGINVDLTREMIGSGRLFPAGAFYSTDK